MNEREAFEKWYSSMWVERLDRDKYGHYKSVKVRSSWFAWQASANREGHKLVPVEPTQSMIDKFPEVFYQDTYAGECSLWVDDETICNGYKAMIGAVNEST